MTRATYDVFPPSACAVKMYAEFADGGAVTVWFSPTQKSTWQCKHCDEPYTGPKCSAELDGRLASGKVYANILQSFSTLYLDNSTLTLDAISIELNVGDGIEHMAKRSPLPVDQLVGQNIRICRLQRGMSQTELGQRIGVTFQQVQKYEKGANRVGASRLTMIADVLAVALPTLFDGASTAGQVAPDASPRHLLAKPHSLRLLQAFDKVKDDGTRLALLAMVECLAGTSKEHERSSRKR